MATEPEMEAVDELLRDVLELSPLKAPVTRDVENTGVYDTTFFLGTDAVPVDPLERLADARVGLCLFLEEAIKALETPHDVLTPDQRIHISTIVSFIEALTVRFDRIRVPNFTQKRPNRRP